MKEELISIVIPVFNTPIIYLEKCLNSIVSQTYSNVEIIIVDDGSNIETCQFLDKYCELYPSIVLIHKKNEGVSVARNIGIDRANGKWITFVDSDDIISNDYIEELVKYSDGMDLVIGNVKEFKEEKAISDIVRKTNNVLKITKDNINVLYQTAFISKNSSIGNVIGPFCKLYKVSIIKENNIQFDKSLKHGEDLIFNFDYFQYISKAYYLEKEIYFYRRNNYSSATRQYDSLLSKKRELLIETLNFKFGNVVKTYKDDYYDFLIFMLKTTVSNQVFNINNKKSLNEKIEEYKTIVGNKYYKDCIDNINEKQLGKGRRTLVYITRKKMYCLLPIYSAFVK